MYDLKKRKVLVSDHGPYSFMAEKLAEDFGTVFYYSPWKGSLPRPEKAMIGEGLDGITNVPEFADALKEIDPKRDLVCFFDVGEGSQQEDLRRRGYNVFGMGNAEALEMDRKTFKDELSKWGLPVIPYKHIVGIDALDEHLQKVENKYVKITAFRWLTETWHHISYAHSKSRLRKLQHDAGAFGSKIEFIVEDPIDTEVEAGTDNFVTDKGYFDACLYGYEVKGKLYVAKTTEIDKLPKPLKRILSKAIPYFKNTKPRGMFSTEARISKDLTPYFNDMTARGGMPPSELECEIWKNFNEAVFATAIGERIKLEPAAKYGCQLELSSDWARTESLVVEFPDKIKRFVKLQNMCKIDGNYKYIPQDKWDIVGAAIGLGKTYEEAQVNAHEVAKKIVADSLDYDESAFDKVDEYLKSAEKIGMGTF